MFPEDSLPIPAAYRKFAFQTICHSKNLDIFSLIGPKRSPPEYATWDPNWAVHISVDFRIALQNRFMLLPSFHASGGRFKEVLLVLGHALSVQRCHRPCQSILLVSSDSLRLPRASEFGEAVVRGPSERISEEVQLWKKKPQRLCRHDL